MNEYSAIPATLKDGQEQASQELADESHLGHIMGIQSALMVAAVTVVCLRLYVRMRLVRSHGSDDWTMAVAAVRSYAQKMRSKLLGLLE